MELESFLDFLDEDDIRIKGTRVGLEHVIEYYKQGASPEEITMRFPSVSLVKAYAAITYYLANKDQVEAYIQRWKDWSEEHWRQQQKDPRVIAIKQKLEAHRELLRQQGKYPFAE